MPGEARQGLPPKTAYGCRCHSSSPAVYLRVNEREHLPLQIIQENQLGRFWFAWLPILPLPPNPASQEIDYWTTYGTRQSDCKSSPPVSHNIPHKPRDDCTHDTYYNGFPAHGSTYYTPLPRLSSITDNPHKKLILNPDGWDNPAEDRLFHDGQCRISDPPVQFI